MERNGVELDENALGKQQLDVIAQMETIKTQAFELAGNAFNLESPKQIQQILFSNSLSLCVTITSSQAYGAPLSILT
jgi:DNA polymerase I-like protein with 3'-5' exonuclease and polymerase domains